MSVRYPGLRASPAGPAEMYPRRKCSRAFIVLSALDQTEGREKRRAAVGAFVCVRCTAVL